MDEEFFKSLLDNLSEGVYFVNRERQITYWNKASEQISGFSAEEVMGRYCGSNILRHINKEGLLLCKGLCPLAATIIDGEARETEVYLHHKAGHRVPVRIRTSPVRDASGAIIGAVEIFIDNSAKIDTQRRLKELEQMALLDELTQLPNRRYIEVNLRSRLEEIQRYGWPFGILFIDVDYFKRINDTYGHDIGDEVLRMLGRTFTLNARYFDVVGRWGGEEFVAILRNVNPAQLRIVADRLRVLANESRLTVCPTTVNVTLSIGATMAHPDDTVESIIKRADELMYQSKHSGRNCVTVEHEIT